MAFRPAVPAAGAVNDRIGIIKCLTKDKSLTRLQGCSSDKGHTVLLSRSSGFTAEMGKLSIKGQIVNIFSFVGHRVSVTTTQLCRHREKLRRGCLSKWGCVPVKAEFYIIVTNLGT